MHIHSSVQKAITRPLTTEMHKRNDASVPTQEVRVSVQTNGDLPDLVAKGVDLSFLEPSTRPDSLGRLDHYEILALRGQGGFGIVLKALDEKLQRIVALKVLPPQFFASPLARKRFLREAQAAAAVHDDHVVAIFAVENGPCPYIAMEYVDGPSLQEKIDRDGPLPLDEILRIGRQIACGLAAAHQQGLIHRDIKPSNILLENGVARVKITDFGLARAVDDVSLTQSGIVHGTPAYMAPEQTSGDLIDHRADLFSLGSVLYTLATGRMPFHAVSSLAMLKCVKDDVTRPIRIDRPELPAWFEDLIAKLHAKQPGERFQSAREVADELAKHLSGVKTFGSAYLSVPVRHRYPTLIAAPVVAALALFVGLRAAGFGASELKVKDAAASPADSQLAVAPFDTDEAHRYQEVWSRRLQTPVEHVNSIGMKLRLLPPGDFANAGEFAHVVRISEPFYMGATEVTVAEYRAFVEATHYKTHAERDPLGGKVWNASQRRVDQRPDINWRNSTFAQTDSHPVCCMTWPDAVAFCEWLSQREGKRYRLPTEAEWDYACRAGTTTPYSYGAAPDVSQMNVGMRGTMPVGSFPPNAFGLADMHGNVYEWCLDALRSYEAGLAINPRGPDEGPKRVLRGGCYSSGLSTVTRSDRRGYADADHAYAGNGFRVVLECR
jgi:formylglycine-generating enzyme required for sulfatase activity